MAHASRPLRIVLVGSQTAGTFSTSTRNTTLQYFICHAHQANDVLALHPEYEFDIILYELAPTGGNDLAMLERVCEAFSSIPVIVVVERYTATVAEPAFRLGAADVWERARFAGETFLEDVRQAIHLRKEEVEVRQERVLEYAVQLLRQRRTITREALAPEMLGVKPIKESMPTKFLQLTTSYGNLIDPCSTGGESPASRPGSHAMSQKLHVLASDLGSLRAGAGDVIDLHGEAVKRKFGTGISHERGHSILIELMSDLAIYYRRLD